MNLPLGRLAQRCESKNDSKIDNNITKKPSLSGVYRPNPALYITANLSLPYAIVLLINP